MSADPILITDAESGIQVEMPVSAVIAVLYFLGFGPQTPEKEGEE